MANMQWFRFYHSVANNRKVQRLPARLFRTWVNLLCLASENGERGTLPAPEDLAFGMRTSAAKANIDLERLIEAGLIDRDGDTLRMHDWDDWQYESDSSTPRVREYRARKNETPMKRFRNDGVTPPDTEADTEADREFVLGQSTQESAVSDTQIGLSPDPPSLAESEPETDTYLCGRCRSPVDHGTGYCPICNARLNW